MSARFLILGNSHTHALKLALDKSPKRWRDFDTHILGLRGEVMRQLLLTDGNLSAASDGAKTALAALTSDGAGLDLQHYTAIAVVGLGYQPLNLISLARQVTWPGLPSLDRVTDLAKMQATLVSQNAARSALAAQLEETTGLRLGRMIAGQVETPVYVLPCPRLSQRAKWTSVPRFSGIGRMIKAGDGAVLDQLWEDVARDVCQRAGLHYIPQPRDTVTEDLLTRRRYMIKKTVTLETVHGPLEAPDMTHGNAAYGAKMLDGLMAHSADRPQQAA